MQTPGNQIPTSHVWYACYGSNLSSQRISCYIQGGKPLESNRNYQGCTDKTPPLKDRQYVIYHELYFAKSSPIWDNGGVAFLKPEKDPEYTTLGRMYLITEEQFIQVLRQENGQDPDDTSMTIDLKRTIQKGAITIGNGWYSHVMFLGFKDEVPIFTFTSPDILTPNPPGPHYLQTIRSGIHECYPSLTDSDIDEYFRRCGVD
jgi:hypothetical protein